MTLRLRELQHMSIFELVNLVYKFIRFELVHAGVAVAVFGIIFLILKPWDNAAERDNDAHPFWFIGPPLIYFTIDLALAMFLHLSLRNELKPKYCFTWMVLQMGNLILLTVLGFYMVWTYYYRGHTYLRLTIALIVLYCYKAYRMSQLYRLVVLMRNRCVLTSSFGSGVPVPNMNIPSSNEKQPYIISQNSFPQTFTSASNA